MKWDSTQIENQHFQYRLGSKLVEELIASHSLLDILLELSQNSYDAYAKKLTIDFRDNDVIIQDDGEGFSVDGWRRVTVVLSTGYIGENSETVDSKSNSLGSKNIGLRTLFLIGDKIHIKSRGKQTIINIVTGVPDAQIPDSETSQNKGVFIRTQFRQFATGNLLPFTLQQEQYLLDKIADKIGPSLIKLSGYDGKKGLKEVVVRSSRCNKEIVFRLKTEKEKCTVKNLKIIHRYATISSSYLPEKSKLTTIHEIEYQHLIDLPAEYNTPDFVKKNIPKYFGSNKNIAMGFSVRLKRGKLDLNAQGNLYYPIVVPEAYTKSCISISAPFMLDSKRENIQPPNPQSWNLWLLETASDSIVTLMKDDWDKRFGVDGFIAAVKRDDNTSYFSTLLDNALRTSKCWPTRKRAEGKRKTAYYEELKKVNLFNKPQFETLLDVAQLLDARIAYHDDLKKELIKLGIKTFTLNSAVRLKCAGESYKELHTKLNDKESDYHYINFPEQVRNEELQKQFISLLQMFRKNLSKDNLQDLKFTATTLTATNDLKPAEELIIVPDDIWNSCGVPKEKRVHPKFSDYSVMTQLAQSFDLGKWIEDVGKRSFAGTASEEERDALYRVIISRRSMISRKLFFMLRNLPVIRDHLNKWTEPKNIITNLTAEAAYFRPVLHFPHTDYMSNKLLWENLKFRKKIVSADLLKMAEYIEGTKDTKRAIEFINVLNKHLILLNKKTITGLKNYAYVPSDAEQPLKPSELYAPSKINKLCLKDNYSFAVGASTQFLGRLGCDLRPFAEHIIKRIKKDKDENLPLENFEIVYTELAQALKREKLPSTKYENEQILWNGQKYTKPIETLVGRDNQKKFGDFIPVFKSKFAKSEQVYVSLGVRTQPERQHWTLLLDNISDKYTLNGCRPLNQEEVKLIIEAYNQLNSPPLNLNLNKPYFLGRSRKLFCLTDIKQGKLLKDDDNSLAKIITDANFGVDFAIEDPEITSFYEKVDIKFLSLSYKNLGYYFSDETPGPTSFKAADELSLLKSEQNYSALFSLITNSVPNNKINPVNLQVILNWTDIKFYNNVHMRIQLLGHEIEVPRKFVNTNNILVLKTVSSRRQAREIHSSAIAALATDNCRLQSLLADRISRFLECDGTEDIEAFMIERNIPWQRKSQMAVGIDSNIDSSAPESSPDKPNQESKNNGNVIERELNPLPIPQNKPGGGGHKSFPPLDQVHVTIIVRDLPLIQPRLSGLGGWGGGHIGSGDPDWDKDVGRQGEHIVFNEEIAKVKSFGFDPGCVIWESQNNPQSSYDIKSIDKDGKELWIEVKSTTGTGASFPWTSSEFSMAVKKQDSYYLCRVYEADSIHPAIETFKNPVKLLLEGKITLDFETGIVKMVNPDNFE